MKTKKKTKKQSSVETWKGKTFFTYTINCSIIVFYIRLYKKLALKNFWPVKSVKERQKNLFCIFHFKFWMREIHLKQSLIKYNGRTMLIGI